MINALANEEFPMGSIHGEFKSYICNNIAQYDNAEVYVSHETLLEKCKLMSVFSDERLNYNAIEMFFVEMIVFQDAATSRVYSDLMNEAEKNQSKQGVYIDKTKYNELSFEMLEAIRFTDYEQFLFPTVRESAKKLAKAFGIEHIYERYESNKKLLDDIIKTNELRWEEKQSRIRNIFLVLISATSIIGTLGEIIFVINSDVKNGLFAYISAAIILVTGAILYSVINQVFVKKSKSDKKVLK